MKCMLCESSSEVTETANLSPSERTDVVAKNSEWQFITLSVQRNGGSEVLKSGHACPDCVLLGLEKIALIMG
jgi:hypothetical protein